MGLRMSVSSRERSQNMLAGKDLLIEQAPGLRVDWAQPVGARRSHHSHRSHRTAALGISHWLTVSHTDSGYLMPCSAQFIMQVAYRVPIALLVPSQSSHCYIGFLIGSLRATLTT